MTRVQLEDVPSRIPAISPGAACSEPGQQSRSAEPSVARRVQPWLSPAKSLREHQLFSIFLIHFKPLTCPQKLGNQYRISQSHWSVVTPTHTVCDKFNPTSDSDIKMAVFLKLLNLTPLDAKLPFQGNLGSSTGRSFASLFYYLAPLV